MRIKFVIYFRPMNTLFSKTVQDYFNSWHYIGITAFQLCFCKIWRFLFL